MWNLKCTIVPVIIRATAIVTGSLRKNLEAVPRKHSMMMMMTTMIIMMIIIIIIIRGYDTFLSMTYLFNSILLMFRNHISINVRTISYCMRCGITG